MLSENFLDFILSGSFHCVNWVWCRGQQNILCIYLLATMGFGLNPYTWTKSKQRVCSVLIASPSGPYKMEGRVVGGKELDLQREKGTHQVEWDKEIRIYDSRVRWGEENWG